MKKKAPAKKVSKKKPALRGEKPLSSYLAKEKNKKALPRKPQEFFSSDELRNLRISFGKRERQRIQIYKDEIKSLKHSLSRKAQQWLNSESKYQKLLASIKKLIDAG